MVIYVYHFLKVCNIGAFIVWVSIVLYRIFQELSVFLSGKYNLRVEISSIHRNMCDVIVVTLWCNQNQHLELTSVNYASESGQCPTYHLHKVKQSFKVMFIYVTLVVG